MKTFHAREYSGTEYVEPGVPSKSTASARDGLNDTAVQALPWTCLLISFNKDRLRALKESASKTGWRPLAACSIGQAMRLHERWQTQLAVLDLGSMPEKQKETFRKFGAKYSGETESLMMVCEDEATAGTELWARKLAVWLYLPEVNLAGGVENLYQEAIKIAKKMDLHKSIRSTVG